MDELPFFENYRAGGFGSVRGFERFTLGPRIASSNTYRTATTGWADLDNDGLTDSGELLPSAYVLCEDPTLSLGRGCEPGKLISTNNAVNTSSQYSSYGGNILMEFSTELILPIPFVEDSRTMQLVAFVDAGNVFLQECWEGQLNCQDPSLSNLSSSFGLAFKWLSAMGPLSFSIAEPINKNEYDETKFFDFSFGTGF